MNFWQDKFNYSRSKVNSDIEIIKNFFPKCVSVACTEIEKDLAGIDYVAKLNDGAEIFIDVKTREKGASRYWKHGDPELALEIFSIVEPPKIGWTLSGQSKTHYILYTFDPADSELFFMLPFQFLRKAFFQNFAAWKKEYGVKQQGSDSWRSSAVFVPAGIVTCAINTLMRGQTTSQGT